ncbi:hypothetical protein Hanom_Chr12g01145371 [Helianthus anomalus]
MLTTRVHLLLDHLCLDRFRIIHDMWRMLSLIYFEVKCMVRAFCQFTSKVSFFVCEYKKVSPSWSTWLTSSIFSVNEKSNSVILYGRIVFLVNRVTYKMTELTFPLTEKMYEVNPVA